MGELPSDAELQEIWNKIRKDPAGKKALETLKSAGYDYLEKMPASRESVSGLIASVPFLPNNRARSRLKPKLPSAQPVIRFLREVAQAREDRYSNVEAHDKRIHTLYGRAYPEIQAKRFEETADFLEWVFTKRWAVTQFNPLNSAIYEIRCAFNCCAGAPHDKELIDLLDAAFRAAEKPGFPLQLDSLIKLGHQISRTRLTGRRRLLLLDPWSEP